MNIGKAIDKRTTYSSADPYWINLPQEIEDDDVKQLLSDSLNEFFDKYGPDANEDFTSYCSCRMEYGTAERALKYAFSKNKKACVGIEIHDLIDGVGSIEGSGRENDPVTERLLHVCPVNEESTVEELEYLLQEDKLTRDDWEFLALVWHNFFDYNENVSYALRQVVIKHW